VDGKHFWESTADAPLPRREFAKRSDYNVLRRLNRHEITPNGWVHEQNNDKILRTDAGDKMIAQERGWNPYVRVESSRCKPAQAWWAQQADFWAQVRRGWAVVFAENKNTLALRSKVENKSLWQHLEKAKSDEVLHTLRLFVEQDTPEKISGKK
jgi:hypothetical protein